MNFFRSPHENYENHENHKIQCEIYEKHKHHRSARDNNENHENLKIRSENYGIHENNRTSFENHKQIMKMLDSNARIKKIMTSKNFI